jgi:replicative DNA helicase
MARTEPAQLVIVDYLQLMEGAGGENRQREVAALVGGLKAIAREFRIPVVMLCQLNRGPESRHDKRPYLSDARESGAVENDSDVAILIHREDHYDAQSPRAGEADLIVDKNRNGPRATVTVGFQGHYARFVDLSRLPPPAHWSPSSALGEK